MIVRKIFLILTLALLATARAQISPGPLARPRKDLEGATHCIETNPKELGCAI
jgi:hypothetical protein